MNDKALLPVEQKTVEFYGDELVAIEADDGQIYVAVRHLCRALGLTTAPQTRRIKRNSILVEGYKGVTIMVTPGGRQRTGMLRVDLVPLWLTSISTNAIKEEIRPKLERYQREAAKVLWEAFREGRLTSDLSLDDLLASNSPAAQAYKMANAVMQLARQQLFLEAQLQDHSKQLTDHEGRLEQIEVTLGDPDRHVTPEQASQLSQAVKAVAMELSKQSGRNEYGGVYGELYRKFSITSYKLLPAGKFEEAMSWLTEWHQTLTGDEPF